MFSSGSIFDGWKEKEGFKFFAKCLGQTLECVKTLFS